MRPEDLRNTLLRSLPPEELQRLLPHLERAPLKKGAVVVRPNEPFRYAYFPESGLASVIAHGPEGRRLEIGLFGCEGMVSTALALGADRTPHQTFLQVGGVWLRIEAAALREAIKASPPLRDLLLRYVQTFMLAISSAVFANARCSLEGRLARWLLMADDRLEGDALPLTHEFLSLMLGVSRPGLTLTIHALEGAQMIKASRGAIRILDRPRLERTAGGGYGTAEAEYERLIGPFSLKRG